MPRPDPRELAAIFAGGCVGALARAGLERAFGADPGAWPWTTLLINVAGAFALGVFATRLQERLPPSPYRRPLLGTGFCGALTTFSTFQVETIRLAKDGHPGVAVGYAAASLALGMACAIGGTLLARRRRYG
jgi:fluoride exporter